MFYTVIEYFGPGVNAWASFTKDHYIKNLSCFDSIDGILCPSEFTPESVEDWENCLNNDSMTSYITNLEYALRIQKKYSHSRLLGLQCCENNDGMKTFVGYDILDGGNNVSLITNWGPHDKNHPLRNFPIQNNGLISTFDAAQKAIKIFTDSHNEDPHVRGCQIWAIHNPFKK